MKRLDLLIALLMCASVSSVSQIPQSLSYQGFLQDNGQPVNGNLPMTFRLYTQPSGGTEVWTQSFPSVLVTDGLYTVLLDVPTLQFDTQYWLATEISGQVGTTRTQLTSAPYSLGPWSIAPSTAATHEATGGELKSGLANNIFFNNGNIGIGTSNPTLLGGGSGRFISISDPASPGIALTNTDVGGNQFFLYSRSSSTPGGSMFSIFDATNNVNRFTVNNLGNVGIGIGALPTGARLHIASPTQVCDLRLQNTGGTPGQWKIQSDGGLTGQGSSLVMYSETASGYRMVINGDGDVGIGTPTPGAKLHLQDPGSVCDFRLQNLAGTPGLWKIQADGGLGGQGASLVVYSETAGAYRMVVNGNGNVGFGTPTPQEKVHVAGGFLRVDGLGNEQAYIGGDGLGGFDVVVGSTNPAVNTVVMWNKATNRQMNLEVKALQIVGGSDLAEPFDMETNIEPGTVMVIDANNPGSLRTSDKPYDRKVAGIVSGAGGVNPGLTLRQEGMLDGTNSVAIAGRVYCKAEALSAPIEPGDLLTTSTVTGHAMKASDYDKSHGAVIGKAMSALKDGKGLVLVLVNLQ